MHRLGVLTERSHWVRRLGVLTGRSHWVRRLGVLTWPGRCAGFATVRQSRRVRHYRVYRPDNTCPVGAPSTQHGLASTQLRPRYVRHGTSEYGGVRRSTASTSQATAASSQSTGRCRRRSQLQRTAWSRDSVQCTPARSRVPASRRHDASVGRTAEGGVRGGGLTDPDRLSPRSCRVVSCRATHVTPGHVTPDHPSHGHVTSQFVSESPCPMRHRRSETPLRGTLSHLRRRWRRR